MKLASKDSILITLSGQLSSLRKTHLVTECSGAQNKWIHTLEVQISHVIGKRRLKVSYNERNKIN